MDEADLAKRGDSKESNEKSKILQPSGRETFIELLMFKVFQSETVSYSVAVGVGVTVGFTSGSG